MANKAIANHVGNRSALTAGAAEVHRILGDLEDARVATILALGPTVADLEDVAVCRAGDHDVLAKSGHHVPVAAARILEFLADEEAEPGR
jgi:hypothetical protein